MTGGQFRPIDRVPAGSQTVRSGGLSMGVLDHRPGSSGDLAEAAALESSVAGFSTAADLLERQGQEMVQQATRLFRETAALKALVQRLIDERTRLRRELADGQGRLEESGRMQRTQFDKIASLEGALDRLQERLREVEQVHARERRLMREQLLQRDGTIAELRGALQAAGQRHEETRGQMDSLERQVERSDLRLQELQGSAATLRSELSEAQAKAQKSEQDRRQLEARLSEQRKSFESYSRECAGRFEQLKSVLQRSRQRGVAADSENSALRRELQLRDDRLRSVVRSNAELRTEMQAPGGVASMRAHLDARTQDLEALERRRQEEVALLVQQVEIERRRSESVESMNQSRILELEEQIRGLLAANRELRRASSGEAREVRSRDEVSPLVRGARSAVRFDDDTSELYLSDTTASENLPRKPLFTN